MMMCDWNLWSCFCRCGPNCRLWWLLWIGYFLRVVQRTWSSPYWTRSARPRQTSTQPDHPLLFSHASLGICPQQRPNLTMLARLWSSSFWRTTPRTSRCIQHFHGSFSWWRLPFALAPTTWAHVLPMLQRASQSLSKICFSSCPLRCLTVLAQWCQLWLWGPIWFQIWFSLARSNQPLHSQRTLDSSWQPWRTVVTAVLIVHVAFTDFTDRFHWIDTHWTHWMMTYVVNFLQRTSWSMWSA